MAQCPSCGKMASDTDQFCPECGYDFSMPRPPPTPSVEPSGAAQEAEVQEAAAPAGPAEAVVPPSPAAPPAAAAHVALKRGGALTGDLFAIGPRAVLGRFDPETGPVDVDLGPLPESAYVSRRHAEMWQNADGQWFIKDLGSMNGTFVCPSGQGQFRRITTDEPISDGDELALGNARFEFHAPAAGEDPGGAQ